MMEIVPRPYQIEARDRILAEWDKGNRSTLIVMATGTGKTIVASMLLPYLPTNGRCLILTPRVNIMRQFARSCAPHCRILYEHGVYRTWGDDVFSSDGTCILSTYPTAYSRAIKRKAKYLDPERYDMLILDELHRARSDRWQQACDHFLTNPRLKALGMTATPQRSDGRTMAALVDSVAYEYPAEGRNGTPGAIADGWLVPYDGEVVRSTSLQLADLSGWDFSDREIDRRLTNEESLLKIAGICVDKCEDRKTVVFVPGITTAEAVCALLNSETIELKGKSTRVANARPGSACCITHKTPVSRRMAYEDSFRAYRQGDWSSGFQFLVNVNVFTEGADFPDLQVIVNASPTKQRQVWMQRIGRGLRPWPVGDSTVVDGLDSAEDRRAAIAQSPKPQLTIIDLTGDAGRHRLCTTIDFMAPDLDPQIQRRAIEIMETREYHAREAVEAATQEIEQERAEARLRAAEQEAIVRAQCTTLKKYRLEHVVEYRRSKSERKPTAAQIAYLERRNVPTPELLSFRAASELIEQIKIRESMESPTRGHVWALRQHGIEVGDLSLAEAKRILAMIYRGIKPVIAHRKVLKERKATKREEVPF